jgi:hypothetical protein
VLAGDSRARGRHLLRPHEPGEVVEPAAKAVELRHHQFFPADADALAGRLAVVWQDSRTDDCYDVQLPIANTPAGTNCDDDAVHAYVTVPADGQTFGPAIQASSVPNNPQYEMFAARQIPFYGDYNWIQLVEGGDGSLFGYLSCMTSRSSGTT